MATAQQGRWYIRLGRNGGNVRNHEDDHKPKITLNCVENTLNWCGGKMLPLEWLDDVSDVHTDCE